MNLNRLLTVKNFANVDRVNFVTRMFPADVGSDVRHVLGPVGTIRAIKPRQLATLEFRMIVEIVLVTEDAWASRTGKLWPVGRRNVLCCRMLTFLITSTSSSYDWKIDEVCR